MSNQSRHHAPRYVIISPVRDEANYLEQTIQSVRSQSVRPVMWILVNDGSTDETGAIIDRWAAREPWIVGLHKQDAAVAAHENRRGKRACRAKEIEAFFEGYAQLVVKDWQFLVKLDGDVGLEPDYFERAFEEFDRDPELGIGGGVICHKVQDQWEIETTPLFHVRGATKIYRRTCWDQMGGIVEGPGWDTLDEIKAAMLGWTTRSFSSLQVRHYRFTGTGNGAWQNAIKNGLWNYVSGYHPLFMATKCARRFVRRPWSFEPLGLGLGFLSGYAKKVPRVNDPPLIAYLQDQQLRRISFRTSVWK